MPFCTNSLTPESKSRPVSRSLSEAQLVGEARRGRPEAFETLWQALAPRSALRQEKGGLKTT